MLGNVGDRCFCLKFIKDHRTLSKTIATLDRGCGGMPNIGLGVRGRGFLSGVVYVDRPIGALRLFPPHRGRLILEWGTLECAGSNASASGSSWRRLILEAKTKIEQSKNAKLDHGTRYTNIFNF